MVDATPAKLAHAFAGLEVALIRYRRDVRRRLQVSEEELTVLRHLMREQHVPQSGLARLTTLSRSGLGALIQRLEQAGLVERRTSDDDRRLREIQLSPAGRRRMDAAYHPLDGAVAESLRDADALDQLALAIESLAGEAVAPSAPEPAADPVWRSWG